jgi:hypothetical protein
VSIFFPLAPESGHCAMQSACPFQSENMRVDSRSRPSSLSKADCVQACGAPHADACLNCSPRFWHDSAIVGSLRPETHTAGQPTSRGQRPGASARAFALAGAGANGAGMARRLRGPLWGRMSPHAAAEHLWARKGSGAFGFARERETSALTGDIARFWSKEREALDRLDANTTTDGWSI